MQTAVALKEATGEKTIVPATTCKEDGAGAEGLSLEQVCVCVRVCARVLNLCVYSFYLCECE